MDALNNHAEPKKNFLFERHVFRQGIQGTNEPSINFVTRLCKLASTCGFADQNTEIRDQFIDKCSSNRLLQEPNLTRERVTKKAQAMKHAEKQLIIMQPDEMQASMARLKVTQDQYHFPSSKCCFCCGSSTHLANKCIIAKGKSCQKCGKEGQFAAVCKSKPQKLLANLLQNGTSSDEEYCFTVNSPIAKTAFMLNNALPVEVLNDSCSSVNIINLEKFFVKIYPYGCETLLLTLGKCVVETLTL